MFARMRSRRHSVPPCRASYRPHVEQLESRDAPAVVNLGTAPDVPTLITDINTANVGSAANQYVINLSPGATYDFTTVNNFWFGPDALPAISSNLTINGQGAVLERDPGSSNVLSSGQTFRFFFVSGGPNLGGLPVGTLTLDNLTLQNGLAFGGSSDFGGGGLGAGGAIFNMGTVNLNGVTLNQNTAHGGNSGVAALGTGGAGIGQDASAAGGSGFGGVFPGGATTSGGPGGAGANGGGGGGAGFTVPGATGCTPGGGVGGGMSGLGGDGGGGGGAGGDGGGGGNGSPGGGAGGDGGGGVGGGGGGGAATGTHGGSGGQFGEGGGLTGTEGGGGGFGGGGGDNDGGGGFGGGGGTNFGGSGFGGGTGGAGAGGGGAGLGGAIFNFYGTVSITNSTLADNTAQGGNTGASAAAGSGFGGAVFNLDGSVSLLNATLALNTVTAGSGGINGQTDGDAVYNLAFGNTPTGTPVSAALSVTNSILAAGTGATHNLVSNLENTGVSNAGNTAPVTTPGPNLLQSGSVSIVNGVAGGAVPGNFTVNASPGLATSLANNGGPTLTLALLSGSPALGAGTRTGVPNVDQRGFPRPDLTGPIDLGAVQETPVPTTITLASSLNPAAAGQTVTFTATVTSGTSDPAALPATVTFFVDGAAADTVTVGSGTVTFATTLAAGSHTITADYSGGPSFDSSTSSPLTEVVTAPAANQFFAVGADAGAAPQVVVYNAQTGALVASFYAFTPSFTGGVRVAVDDINGTEDIICGAGPSTAPQVVVINGNMLTDVLSNGEIASAAVLASFYAFVPTFTGGVYVAAGTSSSGQNWIAAGAGAGGGPQVVVWTANAVLAGGTTTGPTFLTSFYAFLPSFTGGATVALGDVLGTGKLDVICGAGAGGGPQVIVVNGTQFSQLTSSGVISSSALLTSFYAYLPGFTGGVFVSGGVTSGSQFNLILGAGSSGGPQVVVVNGADLAQVASNGVIANTAILDSFYALTSSFAGGVRVGFSAAYGSSGTPTILTGAGPGGGPQVAPFSGATFASLSNFFALPQGFSGGLFIAG